MAYPDVNVALPPHYFNARSEINHINGRSRTELVIKTIAIHIAVLIAAGHLLGLRQAVHSRGKRAFLDLLWFFIVPTVPIAEILDRCVECARLRWSEGPASGTASHYVGSILGMQTTTSTGPDGVQARPLLEVPFQQLRRASLPYDLKWAGRMTVLILFIIQATGTLVLFGRRLSRGEAGEVDIRNAIVALGGLVVQLQSIGILLLNSSWHHVNEGGIYLTFREERQRRQLFSICLTCMLMFNSYYFRQHMAFILLTVTKLEVPWGRSSYPLSAYARVDVSFRILEFVWPVWVFLLFQGVSQHSTIIFVIAPYITLGFPIEEIARGTFPLWADPLSEKLLVF